jgi:hypothetical protein
MRALDGEDAVGRARRSIVVTLVVVAVVAVAVGIPRALDSARHGARTVSVPGAGTGATPVAATDSLIRLTRHVPCPVRVSRQPLSSSFAPVTVVTCNMDQRTINRAVWEVAVRRVAVGGVPALAAALRLPSRHAPGNVACTANLVLLPPTILVDRSGRFVAPRSPVDECRKPLAAVQRAVAAVTWHVVSVRKVRMVVTPRALAAGCSMEWKNLFWYDAKFGARRSTGGPMTSRTPRAATVCVYRVGAAEPDVGSFTRGFRLDASQIQRLLQAVTGPGPTGACPAVRAFAVVTLGAATNGQWLDVELGGCWRVEGGFPDRVGSADPAAAAAILGRG